MTIQFFESNRITELVRGNEQQLLARLQPLVRRQNVTLDLAHVARIDAAGLAALITLYCDACQSATGSAFRTPRRAFGKSLLLSGWMLSFNPKMPKKFPVSRHNCRKQRPDSLNSCRKPRPPAAFVSKYSTA